MEPAHGNLLPLLIAMAVIGPGAKTPDRDIKVASDKNNKNGMNPHFTSNLRPQTIFITVKPDQQSLNALRKIIVFILTLADAAGNRRLAEMLENLFEQL
jgi:hypothetical protein